MKVQKVAVACAAAAVAVSGCGSSTSEASVGAPAAVNPAVTYPDRIDLGDGFELRLTLPDRAGVQPTGDGGLILLWEGRDLSAMSPDEIVGLDKSGQLQTALNAGKVSMVIVGRDSCMDVDTVRNESDSVDTISPLTGRDLTYKELPAETLDDEGSLTSNEVRDAISQMFWTKLGGSPCAAMTMANVKTKTSSPSALTNLPYQVLVEGEGQVTGPQ